MEQGSAKMLALLISFLMTTLVWAEGMQEDNVHVRTWNAFADDVLKLHHKLIEGADIRVNKRMGGYQYLKDWHFLEEKTFDNNSGKLISVIQWDGSKPEQLHTIEVYIRDKQGRILRDYTAAFLPHYHNAPTQTLISLHNYNDKLHAFRTFDASGYRIVERCQGSYRGEQIDFLLDEDEIADALYDEQSIMFSDVYKACFGDLQTEAGVYLIPQ